MDLSHYIDFFISTAGFVLCSVSLLQAVLDRYTKKETKGFFIAFFTITDLYVLCLLLRGLTSGLTGSGMAVFSRGLFFGQAILSSLLTILVTAFLLYQSGEERWYRCTAFWVSVAIWIVYAAMQVYNLFRGFLYAVDENNIYSRGPYFALQMVPPFLIMLANAIALVRRRKRLSARQRHAYTIYITVPTVCMVVQTRLYGIHLIELGTVVAAMFMFRYIAIDQREQSLTRDAENAQLKIDILMTQIRPHFLFNSLTTIKYLIGTEPKKADEAITAFMKYLRHNVDSLMIDRMIPFREELEHVKGYMELQMIRFGDELSVEYDLECTEFNMPTLTLITLVENAVTYGTRKNADRSGTVTIRSRRYPDRIEVSVEDNGPGFVPETLPEDGERSHIGLRNVRERMKRVANGELLIDSKIGQGTKVTLVLPLESFEKTKE